MKSLAPKKSLLGLLLACISTGFVAAQSMSFTVSTKNTSGFTSKPVVFALWITNSAGTYVKSINRQSKNYTADLSSWVSNSGNKSTDGLTGASLPSHNYTYTTRQYVRYSFTKGATSFTTAPMGTMMTGAASCFTGPSLVYTAPTVALTTTEVTNFDFTYSPNDRNLQLQYDAANHTGIELQLINLKGQTVYNKVLKGFGKETTHLPACPQGIYLIRLTDKEGWSQTQKLLL